MNTIKTAVAALCAATLASGAHAATPMVSAHAQITNLQFDVIDLRPEDGVTAAFTLRSPRSSWAEAFKSGSVEERDYMWRREDQVVSGPALSVAVPDGSTAALRDGAASTSATLAVPSSLLTDPTQYRLTEGYWYERFKASASFGGQWSLAPGSEVHIKGTLSTDWSVVPQGLQSLPAGDRVVLLGSTHVKLLLSGYGLAPDVFGGASEQRVESLLQLNYQLSPESSEPYTQADTRSFELVARNSGTEAIFLYFDGSAQINMFGEYISAVPEADPAALALAGAGLIVVAARRRAS